MRLRIPGAAVLAVLAVAACSKPEPPAQPLRTVRVMKVDGAAASGSLTFPGEVRARYESRLGFRLGGKIVERRVDVGAAVKHGQVLARLDAQDASLNAAQAEAARALAEAEAKRYRDLRAKNFVSQAVLDAKETALKTAAAQAGVARNQAGYTTLVADRDGVVTAVEAEAGQVVAAGQTVLRVAEGNEKEIVIAVPEGDVEKVRGAEGFAVALNSLPGRSWAGRLRELSPSADPATRTFAARIGVPEADESVRLGMSARVEAKVSRGDTALRLPLSAFFTRNDQANVWVVDPATQTVTLTKVETDGVAGNDMRVKAGLQSGQLVVTAGASLLEPGQKVRLP
ncbi:MAG: resistance-nodulation-cell division efflux membrane fusion protein [Betaproteobacteria bacterium]|nr:MAG: resistance-nodulation-cell division efflux membrane fusion protein [Betaproteobacteria bacterium]